MPGLSHYNNSQAAVKRHEPLYGNHFEVTLLPPAGVQGGSILMEHVLSISGLENETGPGVAEQKYKNATRSYAQGAPEVTTVDLAINYSLNINDNNALYVYNTLVDWKRLVHNPLTGEDGIKKDYVGKIVVVNATRKGDIFWQRTFHEAWPFGTLPALDLAYESIDPLEIEISFRADWWAENRVT